MKTSVQIIFTKILNFFGLAKASELHEANNTIEELNATIDLLLIQLKSHANINEKNETLKDQNDSLREDIQKLETENINKDKKIEKLTKDIESLKLKSFITTNNNDAIEENGTEVVKRRRHRGGRRHHKSTTSEGITTTTNNF